MPDKNEQTYAYMYSLLRRMCENVPDLIWAKDLNGCYVYANRALREQLLNAADADEPIGKNDLFFALRERERHLSDPAWHTFGEICRDSDSIVLASGRPERFDEFGNVKGRFLFLDVFKAPLYDDDGNLVGTVGCGRDVTREKQIEKSLQESHDRYMRLLESVMDYIYIVEFSDGAAVATWHGPGCLMVTGYSPEDFRNDPNLWITMVPEEDRGLVLKQVEDIVSGVKVSPLEHRLIHKDGSVRWVKNSTVPIYDSEGRLKTLEGVITDITDPIMLEHELRQAQTMDAVGILAGGVAHDFNNIVQAIISNAYLLKKKLPPASAEKGFAEDIIALSNRASDLTKSLLAFGRKQLMLSKSTDMNDIVRSVTRLVSRLMGDRVSLRSSLCEGQAVINADAEQIQQVLLNLITNARDAMPQGGVITISTELTRRQLKETGVQDMQDCVRLTVADTGAGIAEGDLERIFEPFFTTKQMGRGSGLGLSVVYGIIKQHKGDIAVQSEQGKGTSFDIYLPLENNLVAEHKAPAAPGIATALIIDDDKNVRRSAVRVLESEGYKVLEAADGKSGLELYRANCTDIGVVLVDMVMPGLTGKQVYEELIRIAPDAKVIFVSGYPEDEFSITGLSCSGFICKPIMPEELLTKIRKALNN